MKMLFGVLAVATIMTGSAYGADAAPSGKPLVPNGAWAGVLEGHPRLFGPVDALKARAKAEPQLYASIKADRSLSSVGIVNAVEGADKAAIDGFLTRARRDVDRGVTNEHQNTWVRMTEVAEVLDYFHDSIAPEERARWIEWLNAHLAAYTQDEIAFHNSTLSKAFVYLKVAYATWGENPRAKDFRDYAIGKLYEGLLVPVLENFGQGGGFTECGWYTRRLAVAPRLRAGAGAQVRRVRRLREGAALLLQAPRLRDAPALSRHLAKRRRPSSPTRATAPTSTAATTSIRAA